MNHRSASICLAIATLGCCAAAAARNAPPPPARTIAVDHGATLYARTGCVQCHGSVGQGGSAGPAIVATKLDYDAFAQQLRNPADAMPPYTRKVLSDADLLAIYDHVRTMRP